MTNIDGNIKNSVKEIKISDISAENMLVMIKDCQKKKKKKNIWWMVSSTAIASIILCISITVILKENHKADDVLEIGFESSSIDHSLFNWDVAFISTSKSEKNKLVQIYFGHDSNFNEILSNTEFTFNPKQKVSLVLKRNIFNNEMNLVSTDIISSYSDSLTTFLIDNAYERYYDTETSMFVFNRFQDDKMDIEDFEGIKIGYLNYSIEIKPENDKELSIIGPNKDEVFTSEGSSPRIKFNINKNGMIKFTK